MSNDDFDLITDAQIKRAIGELSAEDKADLLRLSDQPEAAPQPKPKAPSLMDSLRSFTRSVGQAYTEKRKLPSYRFKNPETGETKDLNGTVSDRNRFLEENPTWEQMIIGAPSQGYNDLGVTKPSDSFREKLRGIKKMYKGSNINTF